jgi:hypothetical protein
MDNLRLNEEEFHKEVWRRVIATGGRCVGRNIWQIAYWGPHTKSLLASMTGIGADTTNPDSGQWKIWVRPSYAA